MRTLGDALNAADRARYEDARRLMDANRPSEALQIYEALAREGDPNCQVFVGWMFYSGHGTKTDKELGLEWFGKAAVLGSAAGAFYCGRHAAKVGKYEEALRYFHQAAAKQYSPALFWLGLCHTRGYGVEKSEEKAVGYYKRAAAGGNLFARRALAVMMIKGKFGPLQIPLGLVLFPAYVVAAIVDGATKGYTERLIA